MKHYTIRVYADSENPLITRRPANTTFFAPNVAGIKRAREICNEFSGFLVGKNVKIHYNRYTKCFTGISGQYNFYVVEG